MTAPLWTGIDAKPIAPARGYGIIGILNATGDSFYAPSRCQSPGEALQKAEALIEGGADIIDIGAESTRPGARPADPQKELLALIPVVRTVRKAFPDMIVSVDTRNAPAAKAACQEGAHIVNDVSACGKDPRLLEILAAFKPGYILMHSRGDPQNMQADPRYDNVIDEIKAFFDLQLGRLTKAGLPESNIALDPGIGFGKTAAHNLCILKNLGVFSSFGRPLVIGISMKSFMGEIFGKNLPERVHVTAILSALLLGRGCFWHRAHDPASVGEALAIASALETAT